MSAEPVLCRWWMEPGEEINQKFGLPEYYEDQDKMDKLFTRHAELQDIIDATDAWNLDSKLELSLIHI